MRRNLRAREAAVAGQDAFATEPVDVVAWLDFKAQKWEKGWMKPH